MTALPRNSKSPFPQRIQSLGTTRVALLLLPLFLTVSPVMHAAESYGALVSTHEESSWIFEQDLGWLYLTDAGGDSYWIYSPSLGWAWHSEHYADWFFSWGFAQPQWTRKSDLARAVRYEAIAHPQGFSEPASDPVDVLEYRIAEGRLHATVAFPGPASNSRFFLFVEESLDSSDPALARAWISRSGPAGSDTESVEHRLTFDLAPMEADWERSPLHRFTLQLSHDIAVREVAVHSATHDTAKISATTTGPGAIQVEYGLAEDELMHVTESIDEADTQHMVSLYNLQEDTTYYFRARVTDALGNTSVGDVTSFQTASLRTASEVTQYGITWHFDGEYTVGQFVNGDWWVVGPVNVLNTTPAPSTAHPDEDMRISGNPWGDTALQINDDMRNGSMVVMAAKGRQGYDSRNQSYLSSDSISFPYRLAANRSLISSISRIKIGTGGNQNVMRTAAVLTSLEEVPPGDAMRPSYAGGDKRMYLMRDLRWDRLFRLDPPHPPHSWSDYERRFQRVWIDHLNGSWHGQWLLPIENQPDYGYDFVRNVGRASLMLHLNVPRERKEPLLIGLLQYGIDLRGIVSVGGRWNVGGGHTSGRKWPILFAGLMFDDEHFFDMPASAIFHEDTQTYWGEGFYGNRALWQMVTHHGSRLPYQHLHPMEWADHDNGWALTSESYRTCCNANGWGGQTLAALLMEAKSLWDHDAYFENVQDWMREEDIYTGQRGGRRGRPRPDQEGSASSPFVTEMWRAYRPYATSQPHGDTHRKWRARGGHWMPNFMPPAPEGMEPW